MRSLIFILLSFSALAEVCLEGRQSKWDATGTFVGPYEKCFIKVKNNSGLTLSQGMVVISDTSQTNPHVITTSTTAGAQPLCLLKTNCSASAICECQTYGYNDTAKFLVTNAVASAGHSAFISEGTAGKIQAEVKANIAGQDVPIGTFLETVSSTTDAKIFIKLR